MQPSDPKKTRGVRRRHRIWNVDENVPAGRGAVVVFESRFDCAAVLCLWLMLPSRRGLSSQSWLVPLIFWRTQFWVLRRRERFVLQFVLAFLLSQPC